MTCRTDIDRAIDEQRAEVEAKARLIRPSRPPRPSSPEVRPSRRRLTRPGPDGASPLAAFTSDPQAMREALRALGLTDEQAGQIIAGEVPEVDLSGLDTPPLPELDGED